MELMGRGGSVLGCPLFKNWMISASASVLTGTYGMKYLYVPGGASWTPDSEGGIRDVCVIGEYSSPIYKCMCSNVLFAKRLFATRPPRVSRFRPLAVAAGLPGTSY